MEHGFGDKWDEPGCFVYQLLEDVEVRSSPTVDADAKVNGKSFCKGQFVSVDLIRHSRVPNSLNGPFLRLSDCSGWLFVNRKGQKVMKRVFVEKGLWTFYADNVPDGISLYSHPIDKSTNRCVYTDPKISFLPMQKLYCDRKVTSTSGVNYYRVQGTKGWVFDRLGEHTHMLLPESKIRTGLFAFRVVPKGKMAIRKAPTVDEEGKTSLRVQGGDIVAVDVIRLSPHADVGNGPYLRLADGSGWLFEYMHHEAMLEEVYIETGKWRVGVVCSEGVGLRLQPIDKYVRSGKVFATGEVVVCDRKITSPSGVNYFRVEGLNGWVLDKRDGRALMKLLSPPLKESPGASGDNSWSPDYVRGVASAIGSFREIAHNPLSRVISFLNEEGCRINVYYSQRTIGTSRDHPTKGRLQLFRRGCNSFELTQIFRNPQEWWNESVSMQPRAEPEQTGVESAPEPTRREIDSEEETRKQLAKCDEEIEQRLLERINLLRAILVHDERRAKYEHAILSRNQSYELLQKQQKEKRRLRKEENGTAKSSILTCQECSREFSSAEARLQHFRDAHDLATCDDCELAPPQSPESCDESDEEKRALEFSLI